MNESQREAAWKAMGITNYSTLAHIRTDEELRLYVAACIEEECASTGRQPEALALTDAMFDEFMASETRPFCADDSMYNVAWRTWQHVRALASTEAPAETRASFVQVESAPCPVCHSIWLCQHKSPPGVLTTSHGTAWAAPAERDTEGPREEPQSTAGSLESERASITRAQPPQAPGKSQQEKT